MEAPNVEIGQRAFDQFMNLFVLPEVQKRQSTGLIPTPYALKAAQVIFFSDGRPANVRLNSEVKAKARIKLKNGIKKEKGESIHQHEIDGFETIVLTDQDDPDAGHVTMLQIQAQWFMTFDFIYNKGLSRKYIEVAQEFLAVAQAAFEKKFWHPFIDNLFNTAELSARALLLSIPDPKFRKKTSHTDLSHRYNWFADLGNVKPEHRAIFNKLAGWRGNARYLKGNFLKDKDEAEQLLSAVQEMVAVSLNRCKQKI
jgi:uncharacterized protein (UPF0332 family)